MHSVSTALNLLRRQAELETAMRQPGGIRVTDEQELHVVRRTLQEFPDAMQKVIQASLALRRPIDTLSAAEVENWVSSLPDLGPSGTPAPIP